MAVSINRDRLEVQVERARAGGVLQADERDLKRILDPANRLRSIIDLGENGESGEAFAELLVVRSGAPLRERVGRVMIGRKPLVTYLGDRDVTTLSQVAIPEGVKAYPIFNVTFRRFRERNGLVSALKERRGLTVDEWLSLAFQFPQAVEHLPCPLFGSLSGEAIPIIFSDSLNGGTPTLGCTLAGAFSSDWNVPLCDRF